MTRIFIALALMFAACTATEKTLASPAAAPSKPRIDGNIRAVSAADIRTVLALMPAHFRERHFKPVPIARIHIIDHSTMSVHWWPDTFTYARRIKGHWRIDYADIERVKVTGSYIHAGSQPTPNQAMERTAGSLGSSLSMKFHPQPTAMRSPASRRSSHSR